MFEKSKAKTVANRSAITEVFSDMKTVRFYVVEQTETVRWLDNNRIKTQTTRYWIVDRTTGETGETVNPSKTAALPYFQSHIACRLAAFDLAKKEKVPAYDAPTSAGKDEDDGY